MVFKPAIDTHVRTRVREYLRAYELDFFPSAGVSWQIMARVKRSPRSVRGRQEGAQRAIAVTTFRIYADQRDALQRAALERRGVEGGSGRADASAMLRDLLDKAGMRGRK